MKLAAWSRRELVAATTPYVLLSWHPRLPDHPTWRTYSKQTQQCPQAQTATTEAGESSFSASQSTFSIPSVPFQGPILKDTSQVQPYVDERTIVAIYILYLEYEAAIELSLPLEPSPTSSCRDSPYQLHSKIPSYVHKHFSCLLENFWRKCLDIR